MTTDTTKTTPLQIRGAALKEAHGPIAAVPYGDAGEVAFFRRATEEEYDGFMTYADDGDVKRKAFRSMVKACFVESFPTLRDWDQVIASAGPGWTNGPAGTAVNKLAGSKERAQSTFF